MKKLGVTFLFVLFYASAMQAQFNKLAQSSMFDYPEFGNAKLLQFANGNTVYVRATKDEGVDIACYDQLYNLKFKKNIHTNYGGDGELKFGSLKAIYAIKNDVVIFTEEISNRAPVLYRLIIDAESGIKKSEIRLYALTKYNLGRAFATMMGGVPEPYFLIEKDEYSDNYAVVAFNSYETDRSKRIICYQFDAEHHEIGRGYFNSPGEKYKYLEPLDIVVMDSKATFIIAYAYNTVAQGGIEADLVLAELKRGKDSLEYHTININEEFIVKGTTMMYNPINKSLVALNLITTRKMMKPDLISYVPVMFNIDLASYEVKDLAVLDTKKMEESGKVQFTKRYQYSGLPMNMHVNADGTIVIVFEETGVIQNGSGSPNAGITDIGGQKIIQGVTNSYVAEPLMALYTKDLKVENMAFLPHSYSLNWVALPILYWDFLLKSAPRIVKENEMKIPSYLFLNDKVYVVMNDIDVAPERMKEFKIPKINGLDDCYTQYCTFMKGSNPLILEKKPLDNTFSAKKNDNKISTGVSVFNRSTNIFAALEKTKDGRKEKAVIVWYKVE